jgi:hypothetical protein
MTPNRTPPAKPATAPRPVHFPNSKSLPFHILRNFILSF